MAWCASLERLGLWVIIASLLALGAVCAHGAPVPTVWFVYDEAMIAPVATLAKAGPVIAVINPDSGPGSQRMPAYAKAVDQWRKVKSISIKPYIDLARWKGSKLIGYKTLAQVRDELELYNSIYGTTTRDGVWWDDAQLDSSAVQALFQVLPLSDADIVNPGEPVPSSHWLRKLPCHLCEFEDRFNGAKPPMTKPGAVWAVFINPQQIPAVLMASRKAGAFAVGWETAARHHAGEYQSPPAWWQKLTVLNK